MILWMNMVLAGTDPVQWVNLAFAVLCFAAKLGANARIVMGVSALLYLTLMVI